MFLEHPDISRMNKYGTLTKDEEKPVFCPICKKECETFYKGFDNEIVGCDMCVSTVDAYEEMTE